MTVETAPGSSIGDCPEPYPRPAGALPVPEALTGDGSPWSYLCASMLVRELGDFGAVRHGYRWATHVMLFADPWAPGKRKPAGVRSIPGLLSRPGGRREDWRWLTAPPDDWRPTYSRGGDGRPVVSFFTYSGLARETIYRHEDTYAPGSYAFRSAMSRVAEGGPGFVL